MKNQPATTVVAGHYDGGWKILPILLALIFVGIAGNILHFPLFLNIDFLFGSIFALLVLQLFGLGRGVLAAALISAYTIVLWNHPYACLILTAEVAVVGWLYPRRKIGLVLADTLFWLCVGMPLVYLFYHGVMDVAAESTRMVMIKQAVNGIANAMLARLLFAGYTLFSRQQLLPLREVVITLLGILILGSSLLILIIDSRADFAGIDQQIRTTLVQESAVMTDRLQVWLKNRQAPIIVLADLAATLSPAEMQARLEQTLAADPNFLRVGLFDQHATTVAFAPRQDELGHSNLGRNCSDCSCIPPLQAGQQPTFSDVVLSRFGSPQPVVYMRVPVVKGSDRAGYVVGALNLATIQKYLDLNTGHNGRRYHLLDRGGVVISSNAPEQKVLTPFVRSANGGFYPLEEGLEQWIPTLSAQTPVMERWKSSSYVSEARIDALSGWHLILEQPVAPFQHQLYVTYTRKLTILFMVLLGALLCGELISRLMARSSEELLAITSNLPTRLSGEHAIVWPESAVLETKYLIENFRTMAATLAAQFAQIRQLNLSLEERVKERTRELQESRERYDLVLLGSQDGLWDWNIQSNELYLSGRWFEMLGYDGDELAPTIELFGSLIHPDDQQRVRAQIRRHLQERTPYNVEYRIRRKGGEYSWILARGQALWNPEGRAVRMAGSHTDITAHKVAEEQILASLREKEVLLKEIHHRVKNNLQIILSLLTLQANSVADREVRSSFEESRDRIASMALIHEKLYNSKDLSHIDFNRYLRELTQSIAGAYQRPEIKLVVENEPLSIDVNVGIPCGLIVNELVSNSFKYAFPEQRKGTIHIGLTRTADGSGYRLSVADNGVGFPEHLDFRHVTSLGMQLVNVLAEQLNGSLELDTQEGSRFTIFFPRPKESGAMSDG